MHRTAINTFVHVNVGVTMLPNSFLPDCIVGAHMCIEIAQKCWVLLLFGTDIKSKVNTMALHKAVFEMGTAKQESLRILFFAYHLMPCLLCSNAILEVNQSDWQSLVIYSLL